jgi:hypothetical protein
MISQNSQQVFQESDLDACALEALYGIKKALDNPGWFVLVLSLVF